MRICQILHMTRRVTVARRSARVPLLPCSRYGRETIAVLGESMIRVRPCSPLVDRLIAVVIFAFVFVATTAVSTPAQAGPAPAPTRLPDVAAPTRYTVRLAVAPAQPTFTGVLDLDLAIRRATTSVTLNGTSLSVDKAWF